MDPKALLIAAVLSTALLSGCFGGGGDPSLPVPGSNWKPTGNTVEVRMWVDDVAGKEVFPGFRANFWAFCAEPVDPDDAYSAAAIEYRDEGSKCSVPGPQLRVTQGDKVIVHFENPHFHAHTIHWHGQHVSMEADGVPGVTQDSVPQGGVHKYEFVAKRAGTLWYHCHVDGQFHVMMGLYGVIIVEPQDTSWEPKVDKEYTLVLSTARRGLIEHDPDADPHAGHVHGCGGSGVAGCQNPQVDVAPDVFMLNGVSYPNTMERNDTRIEIGVGDRVRIRLVNTGESVETFHTHGHDMLVTHKDGHPLHPLARYWADTLLIGPAERYDVVVVGQKDHIGAWVAHTHVESHITNDQQHPGGMHTMIVYDEYEGPLHGFAAELPGGGELEVREVPADHFRKEQVRIDAITSGSRSVAHAFDDLPVPQDLCLVDKVRMGLELQADPVVLPTTELVLQVDHPNLNVPLKFPLNATTRYQTWAPAFHEIKSGPYALTLSGEALEATVVLETQVTYFGSEIVARQAGRLCPAL